MSSKTKATASPVTDDSEVLQSATAILANNDDKKERDADAPNEETLAVFKVNMYGM